MTDKARQTEKSREELVSALTGQQSDQEHQTANRTRQVLTTSLGVLREQQAGRKRHLSLALAAAVVVVLLLGPLVWSTVDSFIEGEGASGQFGPLSVVVVFLTAAVLASAVLAGWVRRRP